MTSYVNLSMIIPDINLLIYAYNVYSPWHAEACRWWEAAMNGNDPVALPWVVTCGFVRLATHPRVIERPMSAVEATKCVEAWLRQPIALVINPGKRFPELFLGYIQQLGTAGNLTTDAQLAALAVEHQAEIHSNDNDFARFSGLRWRNPLPAPQVMTKRGGQKTPGKNPGHP